MGKDISKLHPELQEIVKILILKCNQKGLSILITQTYRTKEEQEDLYAKGRTKPGAIVTNTNYPLSAHCWGVAFDFCRNEKGREYADNDGFFGKVADIARPLGLTWGGDWTGFIDKPHLEFTKFMPNSSVKMLRAKYSTPEKFIATWKSPIHNDEPEKEEEEMEKVYNFTKEVPEWARPTVQKLMDKGYLTGNDKGELGLTETALKVFVVNDRAGVYKA